MGASLNFCEESPKDGTVLAEGEFLSTDPQGLCGDQLKDSEMLGVPRRWQSTSAKWSSSWRTCLSRKAFDYRDGLIRCRGVAGVLGLDGYCGPHQELDLSCLPDSRPPHSTDRWVQVCTVDVAD